MRDFKKVAVLGAGVMGSGIAAHLAGAGLDVLLLDIVPPDGKSAKNAFAQGGKDKAIKAKPAAFFTARDADKVTVGNFDDDLAAAGQCDLVFVDGSHAYSYVVSDSEKALQLVAPGGLVLWHDYAGPRHAKGVFRALNELARRIPLVRIEGTTLVAYRKPA